MTGTTCNKRRVKDELVHEAVNAGTAVFNYLAIQGSCATRDESRLNLSINHANTTVFAGFNRQDMVEVGTTVRTQQQLDTLRWYFSRNCVSSRLGRATAWTLRRENSAQQGVSPLSTARSKWASHGETKQTTETVNHHEQQNMVSVSIRMWRNQS